MYMYMYMYMYMKGSKGFRSADGGRQMSGAETLAAAAAGAAASVAAGIYIYKYTV